MRKEEKLVVFWFSLFSLLFLILAIALKEVRVRENQTYEDRNHIALYIYKYDHLPSNYITKDENPYSTRSEAVLQGYSFGGDVFLYEGEITKHTKNEDLREADYYVTRNTGRGDHRLVYTASGTNEVFYTEDHYDSFTKILRFKINEKSNVMWILFSISCSSDIIFISIIQIRKREEK